MSDDAEWDAMIDESPPLSTEEGRNAWIEFLLDQDADGEGEWAQAMVVQENNDMVVRFRWPDGREEIFDLVVRRSMNVVAAKDAAGSN